MNLKYYLVIGAIIAILVIVFFVFFYKPTNKTYTANNEKSNGTNVKTAELMMFYVDWCPHCKTAKPVWNEFAEEYNNKSVNGYTIKIKEINCTEETADIEQLMNKYSVEGFPTIKLVKDGQVYDFDAKPTKANLEQFLQIL